MVEKATQFLAIGGGMELRPKNPLVKTFIDYSGGHKAKITVLPTASDFGREVGSLYRDAFLKYTDDVKYFLIDKREDANDQELCEWLTESTGVFFTGGNQLRITTLLGGSEVEKIIRKKIDQGIMLAGTSAGASVMSSTMITWGRADRMVKGNLQMSPGMGWIRGMVIDSHFVKRGRISRLLHLVSEHPGSLGIGLAEDTGILLTRDVSEFEVIGSRQVVVVDGRSISHSNMPKLREARPFSVTDVKIHVLGSGYKYDFMNHSVTVPDDSKDIIELEVPAEERSLPYVPSEDY
ncbi:MAG: cyanophycinase [Candidatus Heimdallarchaeota archaeon]|nr:cyanophycinase [Candidatus Heimdallarchaeota archaeon]